MEKVSFQNNTPILQKEYSIPPHMYDSAFKDYQRKFVYPMNYILTAVLVIIAIAGIVMVATGKSVVFAILSLICVAVVVGIWLNTSNVRKKFVQNVAGVKDERQTVQFFDDGIVVTVIPKNSTKGEETIMDFSKDNIQLLDKRYYFIVIIKNVTFRIIPKKVFDATEETMLAKLFQKKLGGNYIK